MSFGQGCEGDPLTAFHVIEPALKIIRKNTGAGTINMNTNAGMTRHLDALFDAGLDGVRVSMNSVREPCYTAYFRPQTYEFKDVVQSIDTAGKKRILSMIVFLQRTSQIKGFICRVFPENFCHPHLLVRSIGLGFGAGLLEQRIEIDLTCRHNHKGWADLAVFDITRHSLHRGLPLKRLFGLA